MIKGTTWFAIAVIVVIALALAIHLYGPHLGRLIHGGQ
jgi:hypothetical protein